jgi:hypothetical protein
MLLRSLLVDMAVLALFSPATASAQAGGSQCHATPQEARRDVPWAGNAGDIQWSADQGDCKVSAVGVSWVTVSVLPPTSGNYTQRVLRYSVDTNFSPAGREGKIQIGDAAVTIAQAPGPAAGMAFSPSRLEFTITPGGPVEATKVLFVGSEQPLAFSVTPEKNAPWVKVKASGSGDNSPRSQRSFEVTVSSDGKDPGVYKTDILLEAPGASNPKELVPVTMTVSTGK